MMLGPLVVVLLAAVATADDTSYQNRWYSGECGKSTYEDAGSSTYIVGGREARPGEFPWTAGLRYPPGLTGYHGCGGIIINPRWVISVGHCLFAVPTYHWDVVVGDHDRTIIGEYKRSHEIETYYVHQRWGKDQWYDSDFALIRLKEPIEFNDFTQPACAPNPAKTYDGDSATVSGWGSDTQDYYNPTQMMHTITTVIPPNWACDIAHWSQGKITDNMICAGKIPDYSEDACQGDSGGPMVVRGPNGRFEAVGAVDWGTGCASGPPGVYTRISKYLDWIDAKMALHDD